MPTSQPLSTQVLSEGRAEEGTAGAIQSLRRKLVLALIVVVPLFHLPEVSFDAFNLPKLTLLTVGLCIVGTLTVIEWAMTGRGPALRGLAVPAAALLGPLTLSWLLSDQRGWMVLGGHVRFQGLLPYVLFVVFGFFVADSFHVERRRLVVAFATSTTLVSAHLIFQAIGLDPFWGPGETDHAYPPSTIGHFNFAGGFVALGLGPVLWLWATAERWRLVAAAATALTALAVILSFSQGAWAAGAAGAAITLAYVLGGPASRASRLGWIAVIAIAAAVVGSVVVSRVLVVEVGATARTRAVLWGTAFEMAAESPLVGSGPNAYELTGDSYRSLADAVTTEPHPVDDPHSIPLAWLATAGVLGLIGFGVVTVWALRRSLSAVHRDPVAIALLGVIVAYLIQAIVSIDVPVLRLGLWMALGALAAIVPPPTRQRRKWPRPFRIAIPVIAAAGAIALSVVTIAFFLVPDLRAERAQDLLDERRFDSAIAGFESAIALRADPEYRIGLLLALGNAAVDAGHRGDVYIARVRDEAAYLEGFPDHRGETTAGRAFHNWAWHDKSVEHEALAHFERAMALAPSDLTARVGAAEALVTFDRDDEAIALLKPVARHARGRLGDFWGAYSLLLASTGDRPGAEAALDEARRLGTGCRVELAAELLRVTGESDPSPPTESFLATTGAQCNLVQLQFFAGLLPQSLRSDYLATIESGSE